MARFAINNLDEFVWDEYANHVIRTVLLSLAGTPPCDSDSNWSASQTRGSIPAIFTTAFVKSEDDVKPLEVTLPDGFSNVIEDCYHRISSWPQFAG